MLLVHRLHRGNGPAHVPRHVRRAELRATTHFLLARPLRMRHVHGEALRDQVQARATQTQMLEVLDLVEAVVDEALVKQRKILPLAHQHVGFQQMRSDAG